MTDYKYNIKGCLDKYGDVKGSLTWFTRAKNELDPSTFAQLIDDILLCYLESYQFDICDMLFADLHLFMPSYSEIKDTYVKRQLKEKVAQIKKEYSSLFESYEFDKADQLFGQNESIIDRQAYLLLKNQYIEKQKKEISEKLTTLLKRYLFKEAEDFYNKNKPYLIFDEYIKLKNECLKEQYLEKSKSAKDILQSLFEKYLFDEADRHYQNNKEYLEAKWYEKTKYDYQQKYRVIDLLERNMFADADNLYEQLKKYFSKNEYIATKAKYIKSYAESAFNLEYPLDSQQSLSLADNSEHLLVTARAGSGKTTVLTCKGMILAACNYICDPNSILMLAFNRKAAEEIQERVNIKHNMPLKNIRTFHSLAHRIVQPAQDIKEDYENEMAEHLRNILADEPRFKPYLYEFFRKEMDDIDTKGLLLNESDYYIHAKNYWQSISLGGDRVNSFGEKCISDFLFEYDLTYKYEQPYLILQNGNKSIYKPDFTIYDSDSGKTFILEHWAIPDKSNYADRKVWNTSAKTERQYASERDTKRKYWKMDYCRKREHYLLETDITWLSRGRDDFERQLKDLFEANNIECKKLPEEQLLEKVYRKHSNKLFKLFVSFIQKCRKHGYAPKDIKEVRNKYKTDNEKEQAFLRVAPEVYERYENALVAKQGYDFDSLLNNAILSILDSRGECKIYDNKNDINIKVKDLKYILVDEFQDFSKQFNNIISAIREVNPSVRLFCVGDDWQAINGFAGSDLKYFHEFISTYPGAENAKILYNYRSDRKIVKAGNRLMDGNGDKSLFSDSKADGSVEIISIQDYDIEARNSQAETQQFNDDCKYVQACEIRIRKKDGDEWILQDYDTARYLKAIHSILKKHIKMLSQKDNNCFVLTRGNRFGCFQSSNYLKDKILEIFSDEDKRVLGGEDRLKEKIQVMTAHKSKGKEANIVFVLKCNERTFPMVHPDNRLFGIFNENEETVLAEEKRLFYVALTRAMNKVFLVTEEEDQSSFLNKCKRRSKSVPLGGAKMYRLRSV